MLSLSRRSRKEIEERTAYIRRDFRLRYGDGDELRQRKFEAQSGLCEICRDPLQDSCRRLTNLDHAVSIYLWASWPEPIEEAAAFANDERNIVAVHPSCNTAKGRADIMEFLESLQTGERKINKPRTYTPEEIEEKKKSVGGDFVSVKITAKQRDGLDELSRQGFNISHLLRKIIDQFLERHGLPEVEEVKK